LFLTTVVFATTTDFGIQRIYFPQGTTIARIAKLGRIDPQTGIVFVRASLRIPSSDKDPQWIARVDHQVAEKHRISGRYLYDYQLGL
jgi:hypothetical protein